MHDAAQECDGLQIVDRSWIIGKKREKKQTMTSSTKCNQNYGNNKRFDHLDRLLATLDHLIHGRQIE